MSIRAKEGVARALNTAKNKVMEADISVMTAQLKDDRRDKDSTGRLDMLDKELKDLIGVIDATRDTVEILIRKEKEEKAKAEETKK